MNFLKDPFNGGNDFFFPYDVLSYGYHASFCNFLVSFRKGGLDRLVLNDFCIRGGLNLCYTLVVSRYLDQMTFRGYCYSLRGGLSFTVGIRDIERFAKLVLEFAKVSMSSDGFAFFECFLIFITMDG